jgi:hypothetical protein
MLACSAVRQTCSQALNGSVPGVFPVLHRQLRKQKKEQEQREFEALQEQGLNPYEVYRVRDAEAAAARAAAQQEARQTQRQAEIAAALEAEERAHRKRVAKQGFDKQVGVCMHAIALFTERQSCHRRIL